MKQRIRVAVTGAAGHIGYALLFRIASGQMFGPNTELELHLLELEQALPALEGLAMELEDCAFPLVKKLLCTSDVYQAMDGVNWAILVGSVPRKQGMERSELLQVNGGIFIQQGQAINERAASDVRVFVVGNPCNTNCLIAMHNAKDIPQDRFYAMTMLDELRARAQLAKKAGVNVADVKKMTIWGNHSATQYPDFENAQINGQPVPTIIKDSTWLQEEFVATVQQRGAAILKARGLSSAASAANAIIQSIVCLTTDTPVDDSFSVCLASQGAYGVDSGLIFSFPCRRTRGDMQIVPNLAMSTYGQAKFQQTLAELRQERDAVKALDLI